MRTTYHHKGVRIEREQISKTTVNWATWLNGVRRNHDRLIDARRHIEQAGR
jgi:hypothetical protein